MKLTNTLWQLPQIIVGFIYYLCVNKVKVERVKTIHLIHTSSINTNAGVSLGSYVFVGAGSNRATILHELGHTIQSNYYGWLYLPLIGIPSVVRAMVFKHQWKRGKWHAKNYYGIWFERQASLLGYVCFNK
jgi:hypothetical protein